MDAFTLIKKDHDRFRKMFKDYEEAGERAYKTKLGIATTFFDELNAHEVMEEEIFYPALKERMSKDGVELVMEGYEEHHVADLIVAELKALDVEDETYDPKFKVLQENVEHHMEEEEKNMFPEAKKVLREDAEEIGEAMQARKEDELQKVGAS
ncbi:MAG: hemerythrin domain-containing protein [Dehalococcoidia bacterium]